MMTEPTTPAQQPERTAPLSPERESQLRALLTAGEALSPNAGWALLDELDRVRAERDRYAAELDRLNLEHWEDQHTPAAVPTPCSVPDPCADGELCDRHETEQAHAAGEHELCGPTCEVEYPSEALRNFVIAKGYPGTKGMLDELLRRAAPDAERLRAERDHLLAELDGRDDEARERWIQKQLAEIGIRSLDFRNGIAMDIQPARELCAHFVGAARAMLGDASNYSETKLEFDVKVAESPELYTFVVQRHGPGVLTPHEARQRAEAARAEVLRIVSDWCIEANDVGGVDATDLAFRLERAGHPLPDEDEDAAAAEGSDH